MPFRSGEHHGGAGQGTLLWIGDRQSLTVRDAYSFCDANVSQLAYREDLESAMQRRATDVGVILLYRMNDSGRDRESFQRLCRQHPQATAALLLGPLCAGSRPSPADRFETPALYWHQWESKLPPLLLRCGLIRCQQPTPRSIAVVAQSYASASALLTIAGRGGIPSLWCRPDQLGALQNVDEIWWDDSATARTHWRCLLAHPNCQHRRHIWITNSVSPEQRQRAFDHGIEQVIVKPGDYTALLDRIPTTLVTQERSAA